MSELARREVWIGANNENSEVDWIWPSGVDVTFTNWAPGQPDNPETESCAQLKGNEGNGPWSNIECEVHRPYVCKR